MTTRKISRMSIGDRMRWVAFLAPALAVYALFLIYPVVQSGVLSFT